MRAFAPSFMKVSLNVMRRWNEPGNAKINVDLGPFGNAYAPALTKAHFITATKADLRVGDLLTAGYGSNYQSDLTMNHIYFTAPVEWCEVWLLQLATRRGGMNMFILLNQQVTLKMSLSYVK